jgi:mycoredoxin
MFTFSDKIRIEGELLRAELCRSIGNEGQARVHARRAASTIIRSYIQAIGMTIKERDTISLLNQFGELPDQEIEARTAASHLLEFVDEGHKLPAGIDLIADARWLYGYAANRKSLQEDGIMEEMQTEIIMYGTVWCGETRRARVVFDQNKIPYRWVDIDQDIDGGKFVEKTNHGYRSVPTIVFPDGSILVEPSTFELRKKLGLG